MALIPPMFMDCVVAIGFDDDKGETQWLASGFLYGHLLGIVPGGREDAQRLYKVYLVSNRHVFQDKRKAYIRVNPRADDLEAHAYDIHLVDDRDNPKWIASARKDVDVALMPIRIELLKQHDMKCDYFRSDVHVATTAKMNELGTAEGDFAYVLGFPMGLVGEKRSAVIVRSGSIARIRDTLAGISTHFLLDVLVFPGNSGGPVISKPDITAIQGTKAQERAYLIGIVQSYIPYQDIAYSLQTKRPRVVFEDNSGLTAAHPLDCVQQLIEDGLKGHEPEIEQLLQSYAPKAATLSQ